MARSGVALAAVPFVLAAGWLWTLRDPDRRSLEADDALLSPADGRVIVVEHAAAPAPGPAAGLHIAIYLNLFDVHVQRAPCAGRVVASEARPGGYAPAYSPGAIQNAGHLLTLETAHGLVLLVRSAGVIARRVTTRVKQGEQLGRGQRVGRILLGSRVDVYLPEPVCVEVVKGQRVVAGKTVIARWMGAG